MEMIVVVFMYSHLMGHCGYAIWRQFDKGGTKQIEIEVYSDMTIGDDCSWNLLACFFQRKNYHKTCKYSFLFFARLLKKQR